MDKQVCKTCGKEAYISSYDFGQCYSCRKKEQHDALAEELQSNEETETSYEDDIVCPWCGYRIEDDEGTFASDGSGEYECPECEKSFEYEAHHEVTYSTSRSNYGTCSRCGTENVVRYKECLFDAATAQTVWHKDICYTCKGVLYDEQYRKNAKHYQEIKVKETSNE